MIPQDNASALMMDLRERMIRIETLLTVSALSHDKLSETVTSNESRIEALESSQVALKSMVKVIAWIGGAIITLVTLLGDGLTRIIT